MNGIINQNSQAEQTKYIFVVLASLLTLRKITKLEAVREEMKEKRKEEKEYTRI